MSIAVALIDEQPCGGDVPGGVLDRADHRERTPGQHEVVAEFEFDERFVDHGLSGPSANLPAVSLTPGSSRFGSDDDHTCRRAVDRDGVGREEDRACLDARVDQELGQAGRQRGAGRHRT